MKKLLVSDDVKKKAKIEFGKLAGKDIKKMNSNELAQLLEALCQHLGIADVGGKIK